MSLTSSQPVKAEYLVSAMDEEEQEEEQIHLPSKTIAHNRLRSTGSTKYKYPMGHIYQKKFALQIKMLLANKCKTCYKCKNRMEIDKQHSACLYDRFYITFTFFQ